MKTQVVVLILALLYLPVQWLGGRHPGSTSIFAPHRRETEAQFLNAVNSLRSQMAAQCQAGHEVLFGDVDVFTPYIINDTSCFRRETQVTPFKHGTQCNSVMVDERVPNAWNVSEVTDYSFRFVQDCAQ